MDRSYKSIGDILREDTIKETPRRILDYQHASTPVLDSYFKEKPFEKIQLKQEYKKHEDLSLYSPIDNEQMKAFQDFHTNRYFEYFARKALEGLLNV